MQDDLSGKVALVTGSSQGIGRGIALELARAGCNVVLAGRSEANLNSVAAELRSLGVKVAMPSNTKVSSLDLRFM